MTSATPAPTERRPSDHAALGRRGEELAATWLGERGYVIRERNWRCRDGEIDLVAEQAGEFVFVEVKARRGTALGAPEEAITPTKCRHLIAAAETYLMAHAAESHPYRIDVVAVQFAPGGELLAVRHYPHAIERGK